MTADLRSRRLPFTVHDKYTDTKYKNTCSHNLQSSFFSIFLYTNAGGEE